MPRPFPTLKGETLVTTLQVALLLFDGFANSGDLLGDVVVRGTNERGLRQERMGVFVFFNLKPGAQALTVESGPATPYYLPRQVTVTVPNLPLPASHWPAFPDVTKADPDLLLDDPAQTPAYVGQRQAATLWPTTAYPFPESTTLVRGSVTHANQPLAGAVIRQVGSADPEYRTGPDGAFVLFWRAAPAIPEVVTIEASHPSFASASVDLQVARGLTASAAIDM